MKFINKNNFSHPFYKDIIRIDYIQDMPPQLISDYGYTYIMIRYGNIEAFNNKGKKVAIPKVFVKGTGDFFTVKAFKDSSWISFELPNHVLYNITKIHSKKNRNKFIDLNLYVEENIISSLYKSLQFIYNIDEIANKTDTHLRSYYKDWSILQVSVEIVQYIFNKKGMLSVKELSDVFPYSERSIERIFNKEVGASPYHFICLVRFNFIIRELEKEDRKSLKELIEEYDYFDQSHFEKDFKKFLGQSIKEYKNDFNLLLSNGLAREYNKKNIDKQIHK